MSDKNYDSIGKQRTQWGNAARNNSQKIYGYTWGDPLHEVAVDSTGKVLGNYKKIKDEFVLKYVDENTTILDLGSLSGKWTQFFLGAGKIICSDISTEGYDSIKKHLSHDNMSFYLTKGYELQGIENNSVDMVFCMDTLVRSEPGIVQDYLHEIKRVLADEGRACLHLPCSDVAGSVSRNFTNITKAQIEDMCKNAGITDFNIDNTTINHGILLLIGYGDK